MATSTGGQNALQAFKEEFLVSELTAEPMHSLELPTVKVRLHWVQQLPWIALCIGEKQTRQDLIPFLNEAIGGPTAERLEDEVLAELASLLGNFTAYVQEDPCSLLEPLFLLCKEDETVVRQQAVDSIIKICTEIMASQEASRIPALCQMLVPRVLDLLAEATKISWFSPGISGFGLIATAYSCCKKAADAGHRELRNIEINPQFANLLPGHEGAATPEVLEKQGPATTADLLLDIVTKLETFKSPLGDPMIRRSIAANIGSLARVAGTDNVCQKIVPLWCNLIGQTTEIDASIRVKALQSASDIFGGLKAVGQSSADAADKCSQAISAYRNCAADTKSWQVRVAVAESLPDLALPDTDDPWLQKTFLALLNDPEPEVRHKTACQAAHAASRLGAEWAYTHLIEQVEALVQDGNDNPVQNRVELAGVLMDMSEPLTFASSKPRVEDCVKFFLDDREDGQSLLHKLLYDESSNVRLAVVFGLPKFLNNILHETVDQGGNAYLTRAETVCDLIAKLVSDPNFRVRHAAMTLMPEIASIFAKKGKCVVDDKFDLKFLMDGTSLIRRDSVDICLKIAATTGYETWAVTSLYNHCVVNQIFENKDYIHRAMLLRLLTAEHAGEVTFRALFDQVVQAKWNEDGVLFHAEGKALPEGGRLLTNATLRDQVANAIGEAGGNSVVKVTGLDLTGQLWKRDEYCKAGKPGSEQYYRPAGLVETKLLPQAIEMLQDKVPNLVLEAALALGKVGSDPNYSSVREDKIKPALASLCEPRVWAGLDVDVRFAVADALVNDLGGVVDAEVTETCKQALSDRDKTLNLVCTSEEAKEAAD